MQEELALCEQQLNQHQQSSMKKVEKKSWEAADWKAKALEANQKLAKANAQVLRHLLFSTPVLMAQDVLFA